MLRANKRQLNTSAIGQNIFNSSDGSNNQGGILGEIEGALDKVKQDLEQEVDKLAGDVADVLSAALGIHEWYSIHIMDACEGSYEPNATAQDPGLNTTHCTAAAPHSEYHWQRPG